MTESGSWRKDGSSLGLFVMCPHADDFHCFDVIKYLVNQPVLDVYSSGACSGQISQKLLIWRGSLIGIFFEDFEKARCLMF